MRDECIKVLLIEDNPGDARLIREFLAEVESNSFILECADRLSKGLELIAQKSIDLVLLDLSLPDSKGFDTFIRVHSLAPELPIVVLTGFDDEVTATRATREGAQDYLVKGHIDNNVLTRAMRYAIERKKFEKTLLKARSELEMRVEERTAELARANEGLRIEIIERKRAEEALWAAHAELERRVEERTAELRRANDELQREIIERRHAQEALHSAHRQLEDIIDFLPDATFVIDRERRVIAWNRAIEEMTGTGKQSVLGQSDYAYSVPFYGERRPVLIDLVMSGSSETSGNYDYVRSEGRTLYAEVFVPKICECNGAYLWVTACPLFNKEGDVIGAIQSIRDISDRKRAEEELARYRDHLEDQVRERTAELAKANSRLTLEIEERRRAEDALKLFAYSVAHDLKSPAVGIYGLTKRLNKQYNDFLDEKGKNYCDQILRVSEHIAALVEKINIFIAAKETSLSIENLDVKDILRALRDEFSSQLSIRQIKWLEPQARIEVKGDRISLVRIFRNLVDNALKYGGERLSKITVGHEESEGYHVFSVSDNGRGLKLEDCGKIFAPFQRHETSKGVEGAGLGLTIVKEIAERHGGKVWVEPKTSRGATFCISISKDL
jgi:PAS domain S-box-containing protein